MHRFVIAAWAFAAATSGFLLAGPGKSGAAGIFENASAEPAFLLSGRRITLSGVFDYSRGPATDASIYRVAATFPLRNAFMVGIDQPFVAVSDDEDIASGIGDLWLRASARLWRGQGRHLALLGYVNTGSGDRDFFPYSSQTLDVSASLAYADSIGAITVYGMFGNTWVHREQQGGSDDVRHTDHWRASAGVAMALGPRVGVWAGGRIEDYRSGARRDLVYALSRFVLAPTLRLDAEFQAELGPEEQRVGDWATSLLAVIPF
jgi:hypothetical protein